MQSAVSAALRRVQAPLDEPLRFFVNARFRLLNPFTVLCLAWQTFFVSRSMRFHQYILQKCCVLFSILEVHMQKVVVCIDLIQIFRVDLSMHNACRMQPVVVQFFPYTGHLVPVQ